MSTTQQHAGISQLIRDSKRLVGQSAADIPSGTAAADWLTIERFMNGTGDENPLYRDPNYGATSAYFTMLAPPALVLAIRTPTSRGALYQSNDYGAPLPLLTSAAITWNDQIHLGDRLRSALTVTGASEGSAWRDRPTAQIESRADYFRENGAYPFAEATGAVTLFPIQRGSEKFIDRDLYVYSDEEIAQLEQELSAESAPRGNNTRYWSDVETGEALPTLVKGPLTLSDLMSWAVAEAKPIKLGGLVDREVVSQPGRRTTNPTTNWPRWDLEQEAEDLQSSQDAGFAGPYGRGAMRVALAGHLMTHWMGDDGFLRQLAVDLPNPFMYGDVMRLGGRVADKFSQEIGGRQYNAVAIDIAGTNQIGETVLSGNATVFLPEPGHPVSLPVGG